MEECGMTVEVLGETCGSFRKYYYQDAQYMKEIASIHGGYMMRDGVHYERLIAFRAVLETE